mmetsp:Transcript_11479/g.29358  ORF Transcript_11479/g.29358 Transcript_11479/m.29358 type:complete len:234 (+) Transcript_11479:3690-4391(+)
MSVRTWMMYGSNKRPRRTQSNSYAISAPSRCRALFLFSIAFFNRSVTPFCFSARMPIPLTTPAIPYAAPRLTPKLSCSRSWSNRRSRIAGARGLTALTSGEMQLPTASWTVCEGVDSVASSWSMTSGICGSSLSRCFATDPSMTTSEALTVSARPMCCCFSSPALMICSTLSHEPSFAISSISTAPADMTASCDRLSVSLTRATSTKNVKSSSTDSADHSVPEAAHVCAIPQR